MTDVERLKDKIKSSGLKKVYIAEKLGISYQGYLKKENGQNDFVASEIATLKTILNLSDKDVSKIFLLSE